MPLPARRSQALQPTQNNLVIKAQATLDAVSTYELDAYERTRKFAIEVVVIETTTNEALLVDNRMIPKFVDLAAKGAAANLIAAERAATYSAAMSEALKRTLGA